MLKPVLNKADFYRRFQKGEFGNHGPMWDTLPEWFDSKYEKEVAIRTRVRGGRCDYLIPKYEVCRRYSEFLREGYTKEQLHISAQCPEKDKLIQGEISQLPELYLYWSASELPMRRALATDAHEAYGTQAHYLLKSNMCPSSWEWLQHLLQEYPDHVIEFTTLRYPWGIIPGHNTVIWEVRKY